MRGVFARKVTGAGAIEASPNATASVAGSSASSSRTSQPGKSDRRLQVTGRIGSAVGERRLAGARQLPQERVGEASHAPSAEPLQASTASLTAA